MARQVLAFGALAALLLLFAWIMHLVLLSQIAPMMHPPVSRTGFVIRCLKNGEGSPFSGFAPAVWFWVALLCVGVAADFYVKNNDRALVGSFSQPRGVSMGATPALEQEWDGFDLHTSTAGTQEGRQFRVWIRRHSGSRIRPTLNVDIECAFSGMLSIRRRGLRFFLLPPIGSSIDTQDPGLDSLISLQADDDDAVLAWIRKPAVKNRIIDLFQSKGVDLLTLEDTAGGRVLRAAYLRLFSERAVIQQTAPAMLAEISALAGSCESMASATS